MRDIRTLCVRCVSDMERAGYRVARTNRKTKEECDKCYRQGYEHEIKK